MVHQGSPDKYSVARTVTTVRGARTIALDERRHCVYLPVGTRPDSTTEPGNDFRVLVYQEGGKAISSSPSRLPASMTVDSPQRIHALRIVRVSGIHLVFMLVADLWARIDI